MRNFDPTLSPRLVRRHGSSLGPRSRRLQAVLVARTLPAHDPSSRPTLPPRRAPHPDARSSRVCVRHSMLVTADSGGPETATGGGGEVPPIAAQSSHEIDSGRQRHRRAPVSRRRRKKRTICHHAYRASASPPALAETGQALVRTGSASATWSRGTTLSTAPPSSRLKRWIWRRPSAPRRCRARNSAAR